MPQQFLYGRDTGDNFGTIFPNCYRTRRGFHLRRLQVALSAAELGARVGAVHENARPLVESASALIDEKIGEPGDWRGKTLAKVRGIIHEADTERSSKNGSGGGLPAGPAAASSAREKRTSTSSR
jgi:hypothetical protein